MAADPLDALLESFNLQLQVVLRAACNEGDSWSLVMQRAGLPAPADPLASGPLRGAELQQVLGALVGEAARVLDQVSAARPDLQPRIDAIGQRLGMIPEHESRRYLDAVTKAAPKRSGIASIFQNAVETAKLSPWANLEWDRRLTVTCRTCGAHQLTQREFRCEFCGGDMFVRSQEG